MANDQEIVLLPFFGQGHLFPFIELCKHLSKRNYRITLVISSSLSSSIPSSLSHDLPLVQIVELTSSLHPPPPPPEQGPPGPPMGGHPFRRQQEQMGQEIEPLLSTRPVCAVIDVMMSWSKGIFAKFGIPTVAFFTSGACAAAMEYATWKAHVDDLKPGETRVLPGLPEEMAVSYAETKRRPRDGPPGGPMAPPPGGPGFLPSELPDGGPDGSTKRPFDGGKFKFPSMEYATSKTHVDDLKPGETRVLPSLPEEMAVSHAETRRRPRDGPPGGSMAPPPGEPGYPPSELPDGGPDGSTKKPFDGGKFKFPSMRPGAPPMWLEEIEGSVAILMNTCHDLEGLFLDYVAGQIGKPVWGVGPLLPEEYWRSTGSILHDREFRPKKNSSHSEEEVIQWLNSKPSGSVLYISFGSEVGPSMDEYAELASALEESSTPFIWIVRPGAGRHGPPPALVGGGGESGSRPGGEVEGYRPHGLDARVGDRGLVIYGWAPQLLILSHPSTGGFLSHCGWNSTVEAVGRGVPILAWPIRGDQFNNAKMVVSHLKIGYMVLETDLSEMVKKDDIVKGVEKLMGDQEVKRRANLLRERFEGELPKSSEAALDAFRDFFGAREGERLG